MKEGPGGGTLWMVQQMCNHGTLIEAGKHVKTGAGRGCWAGMSGAAAASRGSGLGSRCGSSWANPNPNPSCAACLPTTCSGPRLDAQEAQPDGAARHARPAEHAARDRLRHGLPARQGRAALRPHRCARWAAAGRGRCCRGWAQFTRSVGRRLGQWNRARQRPPLLRSGLAPAPWPQSPNHRPCAGNNVLLEAVDAREDERCFRARVRRLGLRRGRGVCRRVEHHMAGRVRGLCPPNTSNTRRAH